MTEQSKAKPPVERNLSPAAESFIKRLDPGKRTLAREWGREDGDVFQIRVGVKLDELQFWSNRFKVIMGLGVLGGGAASGIITSVVRGFLVTTFGG